MNTFNETLFSATDPTTFIGFKVIMAPDSQDIYVGSLTGSNPNKTISITRYSMDATTGQYAYAGASVISATQSGSDIGNTTDFGMGVSTSFFWLTALNNAGSGIAIIRYSRSLGSKQAMTISGSPSFTTGAGIAGDDSNLWIFGTGSTSVQKFTISSNTATVSTTFTNPINGDLAMGVYYDGTDILYLDRNATGNPVTRINTSGSSQGTTTLRFWKANTGTTLGNLTDPNPISCGARDSSSVFSLGLQKLDTTASFLVQGMAVTKP
jgi:hypothetical protein